MKLSISALGPAGYSPNVSTVMDYVKVVVLKYYIYKFEGNRMLVQVRERLAKDHGDEKYTF
jgi:hypothetical protein